MIPTGTKGKVNVLLGCIWGDEGKGKVVDVIAPRYDIVARFQGGPNAGHTIEFEGHRAVLHQVPSAIFVDRQVLSGSGMVIDPEAYVEEVEMILGYKPGANRLVKLAGKATLILPIHRLLDLANEVAAGKNKIGSTLKGIGPAYADKTTRIALSCAQALQDSELPKFRALQQRHLPYVQSVLDQCEDTEARQKMTTMMDSLDRDLESALTAMRRLSGMIEIVNGAAFIREALAQDNKVLAEGAQGTFLDLIFGSYPFVTSSITTMAGVSLGLEIPHTYFGSAVGVFKAYPTRVGSGPFPTEFYRQLNLNGFYREGEHPIAHRIQKVGREFGSTTRRPRRCGWLDLPLLRYSVYVNGLNALAMTMIDVFNDLDEIEVCTGYENMSLDMFDRLDEAKPIMKKIKWGCKVTPDMKTWQDLPKQVRDYVIMIEKYVGVPIEMVSTGPKRDQVALVSDREESLFPGTSLSADASEGNGSLVGLGAGQRLAPAPVAEEGTAAH